jgi:hypothetical protein
MSGRGVGRLGSMVGAAGERGRLGVGDAGLPCQGAEPVEVGRGPPVRHRQVGCGGPQVLAHRDDADADPGQIGEGGGDLRLGLAHAQHHAGLGDQPCIGRPGEHGEAAGVVGGGPGGPLEPGDRLDVVVEHVGAGVEDEVERLGVAFAIRDEHLDPTSRPGPTDRFDRRRKRPGAAVGQVVASHRGDDGKVEPHRDDRLGHPFGLAVIERAGATGIDQAEPAGAGTTLAVNHERGGPVGPALRQVGTACLLAHRHQVQPGDLTLERRHLGAVLDSGPHPRRLALPVGHRLVHPRLGQTLGSPRRQGDRRGRGAAVGGFGGDRSGCRSHPSGCTGQGDPGVGTGCTRVGAGSGDVAAEWGQIVDMMAPHDVGAVPRPAMPERLGGRRPALDRPGDEGVGRFGQADVDPLGGQGGDPVLGDAAGHDVVEVAQVGVDVEGHAVQGAVARQAHADGSDLAGPFTLRRDPHARVVVHPGGAGQAQVGQRVDHHLFDRAHVGDRVGLVAPAPPRQRQHGIGGQLPGPVKSDVAAAVGPHQLGPHRGGVDEDVGRVGAHPHRVGGLVLLAEQPVVGAPL